MSRTRNPKHHKSERSADSRVTASAAIVSATHRHKESGITKHQNNFKHVRVNISTRLTDEQKNTVSKEIDSGNSISSLVGMLIGMDKANSRRILTKLTKKRDRLLNLKQRIQQIISLKKSQIGDVINHSTSPASE